MTDLKVGDWFKIKFGAKTQGWVENTPAHIGKVTKLTPSGYLGNHKIYISVHGVETLLLPDQDEYVILNDEEAMLAKLEES